MTRLIPAEALERLGRGARVEIFRPPRPIRLPELRRKVRDKEGLLCMLTDPVDASVLRAAPRLKAVSTYSGGTDHIDVAEATRRGVVVTHTPGVLTDATADLTFALLLASARRIIEGDRWVRSGRWRGWDPLALLGVSLSGKTLGIVGMGQIGRAVARRAQGFGLRILYTSRRPIPPDEERTFGARFASLQDLLRESDFVTLHVPLTAETRGLIGARELKLMRREAILVNASRGQVVDERALVQAVRSRRLGGAALDVFEREPKLSPGLARLERAVLAPHLGSATVETRDSMAILAVENLLASLEGRRPGHVVNPSALPIP